MAVELEQFLTDKLKTLPSNHPDRGLLEKSLMGVRLHLMGIRSPQEILTEEFAFKVNKVAAHIPDEANTADLIYNKGGIDYEIPDWHSSWRSFMYSLEGRQKRALSTLLYTLPRQSIKSVGELREIPYEELLALHSIAERRAIFLKLAFEK